MPRYEARLTNHSRSKSLRTIRKTVTHDSQYVWKTCTNKAKQRPMTSINTLNDVKMMMVHEMKVATSSLSTAMHLNTLQYSIKAVKMIHMYGVSASQRRCSPTM